MREYAMMDGKILAAAAVALLMLVVFGMLGTGDQTASWNGLTVEQITATNAETFGLDAAEEGVVVVGVQGWAYQAGFREGDVIFGVEGNPVTGLNAFLAATRAVSAGGSPVMAVSRGGVATRVPSAPGFNSQFANAVNGTITSPQSLVGRTGPPSQGPGGAPVFFPGAMIPVEPPGPATAFPAQAAPNPAQTVPTEGIWMGIEIEGLSPGTIIELGLPPGQTGVLVDSVPPASAAEQAGLMNGDIIKAINGRIIVNMADYIRATGNQKATSGLLEVVRDGQVVTLSLRDPGVAVAWTTPQQWTAGPQGQGIQGQPMMNTAAANPAVNGVTAASPRLSHTFTGGPIPPINSDSPLPHEYWGVCSNCHLVLPAAMAALLPSRTGGATNAKGAKSFAAATRAGADPNRFKPPSPAEQGAAQKMLVESHWLGMELIDLTPGLIALYDLPRDIKGVLVDEVTLESAESGLLAGDVLQTLDNFPVETLEGFTKSTRWVSDQRVATLGVWRDGKTLSLLLTSSWELLGVAQSEAAQPIQPGALSPHKDRGMPCTDCHIIMETGGQLALDAGDLLPAPPPITSNAASRHAYRGPCATCHEILPTGI